MSYVKMQQGAGVSSCWHCNRQLQRAPGKGKGLFYFREVVGPDGEVHRVHGDCLPLALQEGCKEYKLPQQSLGSATTFSWRGSADKSNLSGDATYFPGTLESVTVHLSSFAEARQLEASIGRQLEIARKQERKRILTTIHSVVDNLL